MRINQALSKFCFVWILIGSFGLEVAAGQPCNQVKKTFTVTADGFYLAPNHNKEEEGDEKKATELALKDASHDALDTAVRYATDYSHPDKLECEKGCWETGEPLSELVSCQELDSWLDAPETRRVTFEGEQVAGKESYYKFGRYCGDAQNLPQCLQDSECIKRVVKKCVKEYESCLGSGNPCWGVEVIVTCKVTVARNCVSLGSFVANDATVTDPATATKEDQQRE